MTFITPTLFLTLVTLGLNGCSDQPPVVVKTWSKYEVMEDAPIVTQTVSWEGYSHELSCDTFGTFDIVAVERMIAENENGLKDPVLEITRGESYTLQCESKIFYYNDYWVNTRDTSTEEEGTIETSCHTIGVSSSDTIGIIVLRFPHGPIWKLERVREYDEGRLIREIEICEIPHWRVRGFESPWTDPLPPHERRRKSDSMARAGDSIYQRYLSGERE